MSDPNEQVIAELKAKHGRLVALELEGKLLLFRPMTKAAVNDLKMNMSKPGAAPVELTVNACKFVCVHGIEHFDDLANRYALAFSGGDVTEPGVVNALLDMAHGSPTIKTV